MGVCYIDGVFFNVFVVFLIGYMMCNLLILCGDVLFGVMSVVVVMCGFIFVFGSLLDWFGCVCVYWWGVMLCGLLVLFVFWLL